MEPLSGYGNGTVHCMCHPNLRHKYHKTKSYGAAVLGGMVAVIVQKIRGREAYVYEVGDVRGRELRAFVEGGVLSEEVEYVLDAFCDGD